MRKRLAQYYQEESREVPVRIELPPGNYVAELTLNVLSVSSTVSQTPFLEHDHRSVAPSGIPSAEVELHLPVPFEFKAQPSSALRRWGTKVVVSMAAVGMGVALLVGAHFVRQRQSERAFWSAFLAGGGSVPIIVGQTKDPDLPSVPGAASLYEENRRPDRLITLGDGSASMTVCNAIAAEFHRCALTSTRLVQLPAIQHRSAVFVGAFNNPWTLRLTDPLRFRFNAGSHREIIDRQTGKVVGSVDDTMPRERITTDYAVLARFHSDVTDSLVIVIAGIGPMSTAAAADFLASPDRMRELQGMAQGDWSSVNVEAILATDIVNGWPGHTRVIATSFW